MRVIRSKSYNIYIGKNCFSKLHRHLTGYSKVFILVDENTKRHCLKAISALKFPFSVIQIKSGEENKNLRSGQKIWSVLSRQNADRKSLLINLGGGVVCDMGAFCASTYKRGIDFINIPTTLLSQVDASVGGKTGIDFLGYKNQIGTFSFPKAVFIDYSFLNTLPQRQIQAGLSEMVKHALVADNQYWKKILSSRMRLNIGGNNKIFMKMEKKKIMQLLPRSIEIKNSIIKKDPYEKEMRRILNFGHTVGHALETSSLKTRKPLLHGEAVGIGMICETILSHEKAGLQYESMLKILFSLRMLFGSSLQPLPPARKLIKLMRQDKKNKSGEIRFALLKAIGKAVPDIPVSEKEITAMLNIMQKALSSRHTKENKNTQQQAHRQHQRIG